MFRYFSPKCKVVKGEDGRPYLSFPRDKAPGKAPGKAPDKAPDQSPDQSTDIIYPDDSISQDGPKKKRTKKPLEYIERVRPQGTTEKPTTAFVKDKPEKTSTGMVKYDPQSSVRKGHGSHASRNSDQPKQPQCWNDVRSFSHNKYGEPREHYKIREFQIAAGKARKHGGAFEDYIPEESSLRREISAPGGSMRPDGTDFRFGRPYGELLDHLENAAGPPPPVSKVPGLPRNHYRR